MAPELTPANAADNELALRLLPELPADVRFVLRRAGPNGGRHTPWAYPHTDDAVEVRRVFHELRSRAIENLNEQFKGS